MSQPKKIGVLFIEGFADWEYGLMAASAVEWFGARAVSLTPDGEPVIGISGFRLVPERAARAGENADLDAVAVIGSGEWFGNAPPDASELLTAVAARGGVVGGICAGTLALARAGLFEHADHTSNGPGWIGEKLPHYAGARRYRDVPHAVADGMIVSAPGSAPGTFAAAFLGALYSDRQEQIGQMRAMFAREYVSDS